MRNVKIKFKCPKCEHDRLSRIRHHIQSKDHADEFCIADSSSPGKKYSLQTGFEGPSEGKVVRFECEACGYVLKTQGGNKSFWGNTPTLPKPIIGSKHLYDWLKRHKMLGKDT